MNIAPITATCMLAFSGPLAAQEDFPESPDFNGGPPPGGLMAAKRVILGQFDKDKDKQLNHLRTGCSAGVSQGEPGGTARRRPARRHARPGWLRSDGRAEHSARSRPKACPSGCEAGRCSRSQVSDAGPGVPESALLNLFDPFFRPDTSRTTATGGTGLGLAIVKTCAEACQGKVTAANLSPRGFAVEMTLAAAPFASEIAR